MTKFQINDPTIESQWRALILFGANNATYKFALAKSLLELADIEKTRISLDELAIPFARNIIAHLKENDKQGHSRTSTFLEGCRSFMKGDLNEDQLISLTSKEGFKIVVDKFQNLNGGVIPDIFYEKDYTRGRKELVITDNLLALKDNFHFQNLQEEVESRWKLVETAWNLNINPNLLEVKYDEDSSLFFLEESDLMRRKDITSVRGALNGYQKGKCFYSFHDISIISGSENLCEVDHFLPHSKKAIHAKEGVNIDGVWNLVLAARSVNNDKRARIPEERYLDRLYNRNEFYIESKHPLAETIINQTGNTPEKRRAFLNRQYQLSLDKTIIPWEPKDEKPGTF